MTIEGNPLTTTGELEIAIVHGSDYQGSTAGGDPLDKLLELVVQRLALARDVAAVKYLRGEPIEDPVRERKILGAVATALDACGRNQRIGMQFFRDQIEASKVIQRGLHHRWYAHPEEAPTTHRSLAAEIRPELDRIAWQMIAQLGCLTEIPQAKRADIADVVDKRLFSTMPARQLPRLHHAAAVFAMRFLYTEAEQ